MTVAAGVALTFLSAGMLLAFIRLARGPSLVDRIVAVDHLSILAIGVIAVWALVSGEDSAVDLAIVIALVAFLSTVALAHYIESRMESRCRKEEP